MRKFTGSLLNLHYETTLTELLKLLQHSEQVTPPSCQAHQLSACKYGCLKARICGCLLSLLSSWQCDSRQAIHKAFSLCVMFAGCKARDGRQPAFAPSAQAARGHGCKSSFAEAPAAACARAGPCTCRATRCAAASSRPPGDFMAAKACRSACVGANAGRCSTATRWR